jgi:hypothetical protein
VIVALDQQHVGTKPSRRNRCRRSRGPATDHQYVGFGEDRNFTRRLKDSFDGAGAPYSATATEQFNSLRGPNAAAVIAAAWRIAENLALPRGSYNRRGVFVVCHGVDRNPRHSRSHIVSHDVSTLQHRAIGTV